MTDAVARTTLCYLATPYTRYPGGQDIAFEHAAVLAARLLRHGITVYSPIAHTHPIATLGGIDPMDHAIWLPFDKVMMERCDVLLVAHMEGWQESFGIAEEIKFFEAERKPIFDLDPMRLTFTRRRDHDAPLAHRKTARAHAGTSE